MSDAGQDKGQERKPDQEMIEDLQPRDDQSAALQGGFKKPPIGDPAPQ